MATRTATKIVADIVSAFTTRLPMFKSMCTNFGTDKLYKGQTVMAHVEVLPTAADFDPTTGYANGATAVGDLLVDIPVVIDGHKHVPVSLAHLAAIADEKKYFTKVGTQAYVLGKAILDSVLAKVHAGNISYEKAYASANVDYAALTAISGLMNVQKADTIGRVGIVSSPVMDTLCADAKVASGDYHGQMVAGDSQRTLRNIAGFDAIYEYADFPTNNAAGRAFTAATTDLCTLTAHGFVTGQKVRLTTTTTLPAGLALTTTYYVIKVSADTFKLAATDALATAGTAVDVTDTGTGTHTITGYENLTGFFFDPRALALKTGVPDHSTEIAAEMGIPQTARVQVVQDPETEFAVMSIMAQNGLTLAINTTVAALWGSAVGRQAGAAAAITDRAGIRLISA